MAPKKNQQQSEGGSEEPKHQENVQAWDINDYAIKGKEWTHKNLARGAYGLICEVCTITKSLEHNELVQCAGCEDFWHQKCHNPPIYHAFTELGEVEEGRNKKGKGKKLEKKTWWCGRCNHPCEICRERGSSHSYRKEKKTKEYNALVGCRLCGKFYHQDCARPRIDSQYINARHEWHCPTCEAAFRVHSQKTAAREGMNDVEVKEGGLDDGNAAGENASATAGEGLNDLSEKSHHEPPPPTNKLAAAKPKAVGQSQTKKGNSRKKADNSQSTSTPAQARQKSAPQPQSRSKPRTQDTRRGARSAL